MTATKWLNQMCSKDKGRTALLHPFMATLRNVDYVAASNGHILVAVEGNGADPYAGNGELLLKLLEPSPEAVLLGTVSMETLRQWTGEVKRADGEKKTGTYTPVRRGRIGGGLFNRYLLTRPAKHLRGEAQVYLELRNVKLGHFHEINPEAWLLGDGWRIVIMGLRDVYGEGDEPRLPITQNRETVQASA